jgi:hypothetical protein
LGFTVFSFGSIGFFLGGFLGYLIRPANFLVGQLDFAIVISRGANLKGLDQMLIPLAQMSFNYLMIGAIIGMLLGTLVGYLLQGGKKRRVSP